ncbi:MAG: hypothetical protein H8F28_22250 [Fibrella sp.]|nr:hypothetical protein [Armatimonadota bacterium]
MTDAPLDLLTAPVLHCLVCGVAGERPGGNCLRCGATEFDVRLLLRVGAKAYADAREDALAGKFTDARENLRLAASLGLADTRNWRELSRLIHAADPPVTDEDADRYETALAYAKEGRFFAAELLLRPDTPATRELLRLCATGDSLRKKATWLTAARYAAFGAACATIGFYLLPHPSPTPFVRSRNSSERAPTRQPVGRAAPKTIPSSSLLAPSPFPYPYPERLARRYYNDARSAFREKRYGTAAFLVDRATEVGKNTYLLPHTLLLRAQIADTTGDTNAPRFWAKIATDSPTSPYAPLGLLRAAERAQKIKNKQRDVALYLQELIDQYPLSNEARVARKRFQPVLLPGKMKEEALH